MRRFRNRTEVVAQIPEASVRGSIDRAHAGLISGWLECPACDGSLTDLTVRINGTPTEGLLTSTPRPDVPGGQGFLLRFTPEEPVADVPVQVGIQCSIHEGSAIERVIDPQDWQSPALGQIESASWPVISGWVVVLSPSDDALMLEITGFPPVDVQATTLRTDVQPFLGSQGLAGFSTDVGNALGYAVLDGSVVRLTRGGRTLDAAEVSGSPLGDAAGSCIPSDMSFRTNADGVDDTQLAELLTRFHAAPVRGDGEGWLAILEGIGILDHSTPTRQWAECLTAAGLSPDAVASWLAIRAIRGLRVPVLDPLPASLSEQLHGPSADALPPRVQGWNEGVLSVRPAATVSLHHDPSHAAPDRVCVAGLTTHKSGLGQHAQRSITALDRVGLHACSEPFFPAPGGWNPRLSLSPDATSAMRDHAVLLHVPMDRLVPTLAAQPALLASRRVIAFYYWETEVIPRQLLRSLDLVDEAWVATEFVARAFRQVTDTPVTVVGNAVDVSEVETVSRAELDIAEDAFVIHFSFDANSTVARKNPSAAIDAFHEAFDGDPDAVFILKVRNMHQAENLARHGDPHARGMLARLREDPGIRLVTDEWSHARSLGLIQLADCYISLHRSEGYGYGMAEAMALGTPVVATDYSGNVDFLSPDRGWLVPYDMVDVLPEEYFFWEPEMAWADADTHAAAEQLRAVRGGVGVAERVGAARAHISPEASLAALGSRYRHALNRADDGYKP